MRQQMASDSVSVILMTCLPFDRFAELVGESEREGYGFLRRLVDDWEDGSSRFARSGEALFAAVAAGRVVGVCGLNIDPYLRDDRVGRVRHLYVTAEYRRRGVGHRLVAEVVRSARGRFDQLRLRTESDPAARFYEEIGFRRCRGTADCTHTRNLSTE